MIVSAKKRDVRKLTDVRALRAIAHPVRQRLIEDVLSVEQPMTATEAAAQCGITPSAMSYHLRMLEKHGMAERVDSADGRERPWRKTADGFEIDGSGESPMSRSETQSLINQFVRSTTKDLLGDDDDDGLTMSRSGLLLTEKESHDLDTAIGELMQDFRDRHQVGDEGVERRRILWINARGEPRREA